MADNNRIVVITGASAGIGKATAELFKAKRWTVYCLQRRVAEGFCSISTDVTMRDAVKAAIDQIIAKEGKIDVLVNNAGMGISGAIEDTPEAQARKIFDINFFGTLNTVQCVLPYMREKKQGTIVNISSVAAPLSIPFQAMYSATKAAVSSLTEALRSEVAPFGIKVTSMLPGDVKTDFTAKREKNVINSPAYGERIEKAVAAMEKDEINGMPPSFIAKGVYRLATSKNPPVYKVGGADYAVLVQLAKFLPKRLVTYIIGKMY